MSQQYPPYDPAKAGNSGTPHNQTHDVPKYVYQAPQPKKPRHWLPWAAGVAAFILGLVIGAAPSGDDSSATSNPAPAVTQTVPGPKTTVTAPPVVKTVVPAACKTALADADRAFGTAGQAFTVIADMMTAVSEFDVDGIEAETRKLTALNKKLSPQLEAYKAARDECQS